MSTRTKEAKSEARTPEPQFRVRINPELPCQRFLYAGQLYTKGKWFGPVSKSTADTLARQPLNVLNAKASPRIFQCLRLEPAEAERMKATGGLAGSTSRPDASSAKLIVTEASELPDHQLFADLGWLQLPMQHSGPLATREAAEQALHDEARLRAADDLETDADVIVALEAAIGQTPEGSWAASARIAIARPTASWEAAQ